MAWSKKKDLEKLQKIEGICRAKAELLLDHFGTLYGVERAAASYWHEIYKVKNMGYLEARQFLNKMREAGVFREGLSGGSAEELKNTKKTNGGW